MLPIDTQGNHCQWSINNLHYISNILKMLSEVLLRAYAQMTDFGHFTPDC